MAVLLQLQKTFAVRKAACKGFFIMKDSKKNLLYLYKW